VVLQRKRTQTNANERKRTQMKAKGSEKNRTEV